MSLWSSDKDYQRGRADGEYAKETEAIALRDSLKAAVEEGDVLLRELTRQFLLVEVHQNRADDAEAQVARVREAVTGWPDGATFTRDHILNALKDEA